MDIVACTDNGFVMPTGVMMYSVCVNNIESDITFHILTDNVTPENKQKLQKTVMAFVGKSIVFYDIAKIDMSDIPVMDKNSPQSYATYYRLYLTELLPPYIKKVIYMDGDIIVRQSLLPLWETKLDNCAVAVVIEAHSDDLSLIDRLGYPQEKGYFNAGLLLINLDYWRENNLLITFKAFMKEHADGIKYNDQDVLNYTLQDSKKYLPIKYNLQAGFLWVGKHYTSIVNKEIKEAIGDCVILHFTGPKPWQTTCRHPYRDTFFKYQAQTMWKGYPLEEKRPLKLRVLKFISCILRKYKLIPELPPYGKGFVDGLNPLS